MPGFQNSATEELAHPFSELENTAGRKTRLVVGLDLARLKGVKRKTEDLIP